MLSSWPAECGMQVQSLSRRKGGREVADEKGKKTDESSSDVIGFGIKDRENGKEIAKGCKDGVAFNGESSSIGSSVQE